MSSVLFDVPGPRARRRVLVGSVLAGLLVAALLAVAVLLLLDRGIFDADRWDIFTEDGEAWRALLERGLLGTLRAAAVASVISLAAGLVLAMARMAQTPLLRVPAAVLIELFRGLPVLLLIFFIALGVGASAFTAVVTGLVLYNSAVMGEILRAGIISLPGGQREAGLAIGLTPTQTLLSIQLPQAVRRMLPTLISQLVVLLKDTSLGYIVAYPELLRVARELRDFYGGDYVFSIFFVAAGIYIAVNFSLSRLAAWLERRGSQRTAGGGPAAPAAAQGPLQDGLSVEGPPR